MALLSPPASPQLSPHIVAEETSRIKRERSMSSSASSVADSDEAPSRAGSTANVGSSKRASSEKAPAVKMGQFVKVDLQPEDHDTYVKGAAKWAKELHKFNRTWITNFVSLVIVFDLVVTCIDIDERAGGRRLPISLVVVMDLCVAIYTAEFIVNVVLRKIAYFRDWMTWIDLFVLCCGWLEMGVHINATGGEAAEGWTFLRDIRILRVVRICRLANLVRKARSLRELRKMITMLSTCTKTLAWSLLFCFGMMTMWAMLFVEFVHPLCCSEATADSCHDCVQCEKATGSIMDANLLLFKTVIAGDSWGRIAVPIIEASPVTAILFCGSLLTLVFGVMNLVVAVVVDTFAEARDRDMMNLAEELELTNEDDKKQLLKMFERIEREEEREDGGVTLSELINGVRKDRELQSRLRVMDIDEVDLEQLFHMIDADGSGTVEAEEFITPLSRWVHESKTATRFIKYNLMRHMQQQEIFIQDISQRLDMLWERMVSPLDSGQFSTGMISPTHPDELCETLEMEPVIPKQKSFEVAPDDGVEQPRETRKEPPAGGEAASDHGKASEELLKGALNHAEQLLLASTEEMLQRSLQVMKGLLQDVAPDSRIFPSVEKRSRRFSSKTRFPRGETVRPPRRTSFGGLADPPRRTSFGGLADPSAKRQFSHGSANYLPGLAAAQRMPLALQQPTRSTDLHNIRVPRALQQPARSADLGSLRLAHVTGVSLPVGQQRQVPTPI